MARFLVEKQPNERIPITLDLASYLPSGQTIQETSDVVVTDIAGTDVSGTLVDAVSVASPKITARIKAGTRGQSYTVTFTIATEQYRFEEEVKLNVRERAT